MKIILAITLTILSGLVGVLLDMVLHIDFQALFWFLGSLTGIFVGLLIKSE